jgi:hypothetical protein
MRATRLGLASLLVWIGTAACSGGGSGGGGGTSDAGGGTGGGDSGAGLPSCGDVCTAVVARQCPKGPFTQVECTTQCEKIRVGNCADRYSTLYACAGSSPVYSCDAQGYITVTGCETQYSALSSCLAAGG